MRVIVVVCLALILGVAAGLGLTWAEFSRVQETFALPAQLAENADAVPAQSAAPLTSRGRVVVVDGEDFDFGSMERETERSHVFTLKNEGTALVTVTAGTSTCKCTSFKVAQNTLQPGESTAATVTWKPIAYDLNFHQRAELLIKNDPDRPIIGLTIHGLVVQNLRPDPETLVLNDVANGDPIVRQVRIYAYYNEGLKIVEQKFDRTDTAQYFEVKTEPLPAEELKPVAGAKSGVLATITIKPGLPLGAIQQTVRLVTNEDKGAVVAIPIAGRVISEVSFAGDPRYNAETGVLKLGELSSDEGAEAHMRVFVRGPERNNVQLKLGDIDPAEFLKATLGEAKALSNATMYDLTVRVPPGTKFVNHLGTPEHKLGRITITTTHPHAPILNLMVQFAVTQ